MNGTPSNAASAATMPDSKQKVNGSSDAQFAKNPPAKIESHTSESSDEEDYDSRVVESGVIVDGGKGGQLEITLDKENKRPLIGQRRPSIPIRLERTDKKGRYMLLADDAEVREILSRGLERQKQASTDTTPARNKIRELVFTRRFTTFDRQNPSSDLSPFHGFFTLFWLAMALLLVRVAVQNSRIHGSVLGNNELLRMMFGREVIALGLTDGMMCGATIFGLILHRIILAGYLDWVSSGWIIQSFWEAFYLFFLVSWTFYREWPWTHTIFIVLHGLVFLMKQHSYAFYNGHLSVLYKRKILLERRLKKMNAMTPLASPVASPKSNPIADFEASTPTKLRHRRNISSSSAQGTDPSPDNAATLESVAAAISSGETLNSEQLETFREFISSDIEAINTELKGKCTLTENHYPRNLTIRNWADWTCLPTLVYELEYPRQDHINWWYVAEKTGAVFGVLAIMQVISQAYIYPAVSEAVRMKAAGMSLDQRWNEFPYIVLDMLFPLLLEQLLTWYLIWECVLNVLAELTGFADRGFYGEWWNSVSWDQYARDWNRPVHNFLLRHVYHSSISAFKLSKAKATFVTFLLSACVHELLMFCLFKKVRGYLFTLQLGQVPLIALSRTKLLKGRKIIGNAIFWFGLFIGPALLTGLYLIV